MQKYKIYNKIDNLISYSEFPSIRLLKFKRSKWKSLKLKFLKRESFLEKEKMRKTRFSKRKKYIRKTYINKFKKNKCFFKNVISLKRRFNFYEKVKKAYKNGLLLKNKINQFFGAGLSLKYFKKQVLLKKKFFYEILIKPYFKLDVLLWKLKFFCNIKQAQQHIKSKNVYVNEKVVTNINFFLQKGDIVKILNKNINTPIKTGLNTSFILSFCDVDFYAYKIIILKEFSELTEGDFTLIFDYLLGIRNFIYYLKKK
jgi:ribosomal protein S4